MLEGLIGLLVVVLAPRRYQGALELIAGSRLFAAVLVQDADRHRDRERLQTESAAERPRLHQKGVGVVEIAFEQGETLRRRGHRDDALAIVGGAPRAFGAQCVALSRRRVPTLPAQMADDVKAQAGMLGAPLVEGAFGERLDGSRQRLGYLRAARCDADLGELDEQLRSLRLRHLLGVVRAAACEGVGLRVGEDTQTTAPGSDTRACGHRRLASEGRVPRELAGMQCGRIVLRRQRLRHAPVHEPPPRVGHLRVHRGPHDVVSECVGAPGFARVARRHEQRMPLERLERTDEPVDVERHQLTESRHGHDLSEHGRPAQDVGRVGRQALDAVADHLGDRSWQVVASMGQGPHDLDGERTDAPLAT